MPIIDLFRRRGVCAANSEPVKSRRDDSPIVDPLPDPIANGEPLASAEYGGPEEPSCPNAVFGLIGTTPYLDGRQPPCGRDQSASGARHLLDVLYAKYCQALDEPQVAVESDWAAPGIAPDSPDGELADRRRSLPGNRHEPAAGMESIEVLLFGTHSMEHAFGPLDGGDAGDVIVTDRAPEILRLFAPSEFHAAATRRSAPRPPALARREHHSVSIDSAMSVPQCAPYFDGTT